MNKNNKLKAIIKDASLSINTTINASGPQGKSAYQAWLDLGNEGTTEDFINSLRVSNAGTYIHRQTIPNTQWEINHQLDKFPAVVIVDSGGSVVIGDVVYINSNKLQINFTSNFGGNAYLN